AAECFEDLLALAFRGIAAGAPAAPGGEVGLLQRLVQHHAEARAGEAWIEGGGVRSLGFGVRVRLVAPAGGGLGGGAGDLVPGVGVGELGEAVDPPVA